MALPAYTKVKSRRTFDQLPKGAYVVVIKDVKEVKMDWGEVRLKVAFDIAEGEYKGFYQAQFEANDDENKRWPYDAIFDVRVPEDGAPEWKWRKWNEFFSILEDSNTGFAFDGANLKALRGKLIGGKFANDQSSYNGNVYDHTRLKWTCVADDVRSGKPGKMPKDKLIPQDTGRGSAPKADENGFMSVPDGVDDEEVPF
jgi:hypothetical protein